VTEFTARGGKSKAAGLGQGAGRPRWGLAKEVEILAVLSHLDFLQVVWLLPIAFALHEAEEWWILGWYERNFVDLTAKTNTSIHTFLVFASMVGFV